MIGLAVSVRGVFFLSSPSTLIYSPRLFILATYDSSGQVDYSDVFNQSADDYKNITILAGMLEHATSTPLTQSWATHKLGSRVDSRLVDISAKTGYALVGAKRADPHAQASEYYEVFIF